VVTDMRALEKAQNRHLLRDGFGKWKVSHSQSVIVKERTISLISSATKMTQRQQSKQEAPKRSLKETKWLIQKEKINSKQSKDRRMKVK